MVRDAAAAPGIFSHPPPYFPRAVLAPRASNRAPSAANAGCHSSAPAPSGPAAITGHGPVASLQPPPCSPTRQRAPSGRRHRAP